MNCRLIASVTLGCALVLCVEIARAQQAPSSPPPQAEMMTQAGPEGDFITSRGKHRVISTAIVRAVFAEK